MNWFRLMPHHLAFAAATLVAALMFCTVAHGAASTRLRTGSGSGVVVNAESMFRDSDKQTIELRGNVQIVYDQQFMSCDHAIINLAKQEVMAEGNLVISSPQAYIEGDSATMSYKDNTGIIINGFVKSGPVIFEGRIVKKTGPQTYDAESASFTACTTCPTAWTFSGSRIQAEIGGYAYIKHAQLRVANIPTIWLPYLIVPLKSERQSGFLIPTIDFNPDGGYAPSMSFFWAISRSQDATLTAKYYTIRTLKGLANYRYMLNPTSGGEFTTGLIHDKVFPDAAQVKNIDIGPKVNRYFLTYNHIYDLPDGFNQKLKLNYVSDLLYPRDFPEEILGRGDPALENRMSLTRNTERTHSSLDSSYYINQLHANPIDSNSDSVHRIPEIRFDAVERPISSTGLLSGLLFNFHSDYVNFTRDGLAWDDVYTDAAGVKQVDRTRSLSGGGVFDPNIDVIRTGQRLDLQPEISAPFRIGSSLDILPSLNLRHTQYSLNVTPPEGSNFDSAPYREYMRGKISMRTRFSRIYGDNSPVAEAPHPSVTNWSDDESRMASDTKTMMAPTVTAPVHADVYRHEIEPEIVLAGVKDTHDTQNQTNPFLGAVAQVPSFLDSQPISDSDFQSARGVQFDYEDRLTNRNTISTYLSNRLVKKSWRADGTSVYRQVASVKLGQSYDFDEARSSRGNRFPYSDISALIDTRLDYFETNTLVRYFPYHGKTSTSSRARVKDTAGRYFEMNFVQNYLITLDPSEAYNGRTETLGFLSGFVTKYLEFTGVVDLNPTSWANFKFDVKSWAALMNFKPPGNCWGVLLSLRQDLGNKLEYHLAFAYNFGGEPPKAIEAQ